MCNKTVSKQIIALKNADLQLREELVKQGTLFDGYNHEMEQLHISNANKLNAIIDAIGYPTIQKVGEEASEAAWLVIQHAISKPTFMKKCLELLKDAVENKEANPINLACLSDGISTFENKPQLYGASFDWDENGNLSPKPYDDLDKVNARRKALGLNTLEEQTEIIRNRAKAENQNMPSSLKKREQDIKAWKKRVGWIQ